METNNANSPYDDVDQEQLVAYLDGELDADQVRRVEEALANDHECRDRLNRLQKPWDLLDELPRSEADVALTKTTVAMVAADMSERTQQQQSELTRRRVGVRFALATAVLVCGAAGFFAVSLVQQQPDKEFLSDLPIIENVDVYQHIDNVEFLLALEQEGLFDDENQSIE